MTNELPNGGTREHWTLRVRPFSKIFSIATSVFMLAVAIIFPLSSITVAPCKTQACITAGSGPAPLWAGLAGFLFFGTVAIGALSVAWLQVQSDGTSLLVTKLFWCVSTIDLAGIKDIIPGRYGPMYEMSDGTRRHSPIPQGDNVGLGKATKARVQRFIALVLADANAVRAAQASTGTAALSVDAAVLLANQNAVARRSMRALVAQLSLSTLFSIVILAVADARHKISSILFAVISLVLVCLEIVLVSSVARSRKRKSVQGSKMTPHV